MPTLGTTAGRLASAFGSYARIAWWGLVAPRLSEQKSMLVLQGVVRGDEGVLLTVRSDLWGWEIPGGAAEPGESAQEAIRREVLEETGIDVAVERHIGDYVRTGFRPHTARVYACRPLGGELRTSSETRAVRWFDPDALPDELFPWYRAPLRDAANGAGPAVERHERQGATAIWRALCIDLRMRLR